ncbi:sensor histidine kinase [Streptomyces sp. NPDC088746]|uniref:sensor histidine kinase n=1 Tax=Streptomyces sp. NPDC088746 TaxID=3365885 RepID=UPI003803C7BA
MSAPRITRRGERVLAVVNRDPMDAPHKLRTDSLVATGAGALSAVLAFVTDDGRFPDALGWVLLLSSALPLVWRRRNPVAVLLAMIPVLMAYHLLDNAHSAPMPQTFVVLYTVAVTGRPLRTLLTGCVVITVMVSVVGIIDAHHGLELLRISGWIVAVLFCGVDVRIYRQYVASVVERAERAERTREEEARRRVVEERLRIARDLHDLLAHSITVIGVQTSVASHILTVDPDRLDRTAVAQALDDIAGTCREARAELRTTLQVLRDGSTGGDGPLPGLDALPALVRAARTAGATVELSVRAPEHRIAPATGAAAYRIVQEALTNAVRHAGPGVRTEVTVEPEPGHPALRVTVIDDGAPSGPGGAVEAGPGPGFGIVGMRERARTCGGTLDAGPLAGGGFRVDAVLPLPGSPAGCPAPAAGPEEVLR